MQELSFGETPRLRARQLCVCNQRRGIFWRGAGLAVALLLQLPVDARADLVILQHGLGGHTNQDATVRQDQPAAINNTTRLSIGAVASTTTPLGPLRGIFSFPLTGIPAGSEITSVSFTIVREGDPTSPNADYAVELRAISQSFDETTATWTNTFNASPTPITLGSTVLTTALMNPRVPTAATPITFGSSSTLVSEVQAALDANAPFNFAVVAPSAVETGTTRVIFRVVSNGDALGTNRPRLDVTYTPSAIPEPSSFAFLGLVIGTLVVRSLVATLNRDRQQ